MLTGALNLLSKRYLAYTSLDPCIYQLAFNVRLNWSLPPPPSPAPPDVRYWAWELHRPSGEWGWGGGGGFSFVVPQKRFFFYKQYIQEKVDLTILKLLLSVSTLFAAPSLLSGICISGVWMVPIEHFTLLTFYNLVKIIPYFYVIWSIFLR